MNPSLLRRMLAILYDTFLLFALMLFGTIPFWAMSNDGYVTPGTLSHQLVMLAITWLFFVGFWSIAGRTLGMQSWSLRIETDHGEKVGVAKATVRFFAAILSWLPAGLGFWWALWDKEGLTWHDRLSGTRLKRVPRG